MLILSILVLLIILAPLAVGSVYIVTYSAAECIIFTLLLIHILTFRSSAAHPPPSSGLSSSVSDHTPRPSGPGLFVLLLPFLFFLIFVLFQMVPIPVALIRSVSPNTYGLYEKLGLLSDNLPLSLSLYGTSVAFLKWAAFGALFFVIATYRPTVPVLEGHRWIAILAVSIIFIGFVEALYGLYTYVNDPGALLWFTRTYGAHSGRVAGTYVNPNHLAGLMNMTLPLAVAFLVFFAGSAGNGKRRVKDVIIDLATSRKALVSYLLFFGIVLMVLALIFSGSRMGQFGFCAGFVAIAVLSLLRLAQKGRKRFPLPVLLIVVSCMSAGLLWGAWKGLDPVINWLHDLRDVAGLTRSRRTFLGAEMDIMESENLDEMWRQTCAALEMNGFDSALLVLINGNTPVLRDDAAIRLSGINLGSVNRPGVFEHSSALESHSPGEEETMHNGQRVWRYTASTHTQWKDIPPEYKFEVAVPLLKNNNDSLGILFLVKNLQKDPITFHTMRRIESLRRSLVITIAKLEKQQEQSSEVRTKRAMAGGNPGFEIRD